MSAMRPPPADEANFQEMLESLDDGKVLQDITKMYAEVNRAVRATGKKGVLNIKLSVEPSGKGMARVVPDITSKIPKEPRDVTIFYITEEGALTKNDPKQMVLKDITVPKVVKTVKEN